MTPYIGGIVVGVLRPNMAIVLAEGLALWLGQTLALFAVVRCSHQKTTTISALYWLTTLISFSAAYAIIFFLVSSISHSN